MYRDLVPADRAVVEKLNAVWERSQIEDDDNGGDNGDQPNEEEADRDEDENASLYEVEDIVGQRTHGADLEYLVVWANEREPSWTPRYVSALQDEVTRFS